MNDTMFVKTGDCADPDVRENHAKALVVALDLGSRATSMLVQLEKNLDIHQNTVCRKLEEIRIDLRNITDKLIVGDKAIALMDMAIKETEKDVNGLGTKVRSHLEWHEAQKDKLDERRFQFLNDVRNPAIRWALLSIISLAVLGGVLSAASLLGEYAETLTKLAGARQ